MAVILWVIGLSLLMQGCWCSVGQMKTGCMRWRKNGDNVCCDACFSGNRLVQECGPNPKDLCTPCEPGTYTQKPKSYMCLMCTQCVGVHVYLKNCTTTTDTKCGCRDGLVCGDDRCTHCVEKCDKGYEPTANRSCRPCPDGTFNDQIHQRCKPFSTKCPKPSQYIVSQGNSVTDIKCESVAAIPSQKPNQPGTTEQAWPLVLSLLTSMALIGFSIIIIVTAAVKMVQKSKKPKTPPPKTPIIRPPTDDPRTLIAIECSFHEAQQEQGSSSESLDSKDSSDQLIA